MKKIFLMILAFSMSISTMNYAATVIKKEDAAQYSKKSVYADINVEEKTYTSDTDSSGLRASDDALNKFTCVTATKDGNTYTNTWSNYKMKIMHDYRNANDIYDFNADGIKFDFGIYFTDYSRIAVYYSRLSRDLNVVAANFAPGANIEDVVIAEATYKHVSLDVPYPYGVEKYDYYLRNIDGKLMVIELYWEEGREKCKDVLADFEKAN